MEFEEIIKLITENGIAIACVIYLMYFQSTTMKDMQACLNAISEKLARIETRLDEKEDMHA